MVKRSTIHGLALIIGAMGGIITILLHPTGADLLAQADDVARRNELITVATHSIALASMPLLLFGFLELSRRIGWNYSPVQLAFVAYAFGVVAAMCAGVINGLVGPNLTRRILNADDPTRELLRSHLMNNWLLNQAFSKVFGVASSAAITLWSVSMLKRVRHAKWIALAGCVIGAGSLVILFSGHLPLNVHGFGFLVFAQSLWTILAGIFLCQPTELPVSR